MAFKLGYQSKFYRNTATYGTPTWVEIEIVRDITINSEATQVDASARGVQSGRKLTEPGLIDYTIEIEILHDPAHADYVAILPFFLARTLIDIAITDGSTPDTTGEFNWRGECKIVDWSDAKALDDGDYCTLTLKPCYSTNAIVHEIATA